MLSPTAGQLADEAIITVRRAVAAADVAIAAEWDLIVWATGSESARQARIASVEASRRILAELESRRPGLTDSGLLGFLDLAGAAADVRATVEAARRITPAGIAAEVVNPTLAALDPTNLGGPVGRAVLIGAAVLAAVLILRR